jgi:hypothetical protein
LPLPEPLSLPSGELPTTGLVSPLHERSAKPAPSATAQTQ